MTYFSRFPLMAYRIKEGDPVKLMPQIIKRVKLRSNLKNGLEVKDIIKDPLKKNLIKLIEEG